MKQGFLCNILLVCSSLLSACGTAASPRSTAGTPAALQPTIASTSSPEPTVAGPTPTLAPHVLAQWKISNPSFIAIAFGSVWIPDHYGRRITRIDPTSNKIVAVIQGTSSHPESALEIGDQLWITGQMSDTMFIDPKTNTPSSDRLDGSHLYMAYGFDSVWLTTRENKLERLDPATKKSLALIPLEDGVSDCMNSVFVPFATTGSVWVDECDKTELIKVDPATNSVVSKTLYADLIDEAMAQTTVPAGKGNDFIWVSLPKGLLRISPQTGRGLTFLPLDPFQAGEGFIAVTDEAVWVAGDGQINRVDVATNTIDTTYKTQPGRLKLAIGFGSIWIRNFDLHLVQRLDLAP